MILKYHTNFYLESRKGKEKNLPIRFSFHFEGKRFEQFTGHSIDRGAWDKEAQKVKKNNHNKQGTDARTINEDLDEIKQITIDEYKKAKYLNIDISAEYLRNRLKEGLRIVKAKKINVIDLFDRFIEFKKTDFGKKDNLPISPGYLKQLSSTKNHLNNFNPDLQISDFNDDFFEKFKHYYTKTEKNSMNSFAGAIKRLKYFLTWANKQGYIINSFKEWEVTEQYINKPVFLEWTELLAFYTAKIENEGHRIARDLYIFQAMIGARFGDLVSLRIDNLKEKDGAYILSYIQEKTNKQIQVPLNNIAIEIINKYGRLNGFLLPRLSEQKCNEYIKKAGKVAKLNRVIEETNKKGEKVKKPLHKVLTTHTARKSFIANQLNEFDTIPEVVKSMTGHSKESKSFGRYYTISNEKKSKAIEKMNKNDKAVNLRTDEK